MRHTVTPSTTEPRQRQRGASVFVSLRFSRPLEKPCFWGRVPNHRLRGAGNGCHKDRFAARRPSTSSDGCLDYYRDVDDPFSIELLNRYEARHPGSAMFTAGSACTGTYRALKLWEAAVTEAGSLDQDHVIVALDHARITEGPGGPAEMVPGQHHVRMNIYIARPGGSTFKVVENLGHIDPKECEVGRA